MELEHILNACILAIAQASPIDVDWRLSETSASGYLHVGHLDSDMGRVTIVDQVSNGPRSCQVWGTDPYAESAKIDIPWAYVEERLIAWENARAARDAVIDLRNDGFHESLFLLSAGNPIASFNFSAQDLGREIESNVPRFAPGGALLFSVNDDRGLNIETVKP